MFRILFAVLLCAPLAVLAASPEQTIRQSMEASNLGASVEFIEPSPMQGLYTVGLTGGRVLYASADGQFFIQGRLYQAGDGKTVNLTDRQEKEGIAKAIAALPESQMIVFPAEHEKAVITVFTDTSCPFCHKLHEDMDDLNDAGLTVRYLAYPRGGLKSDAYRTMVSVWCSKDRRKTLSEAIDDDSIAKADCDNPVKSDYLLGQQIGIQGTPTIVFQDGSLLSGYRPAETLEQIAMAIKGD